MIWPAIGISIHAGPVNNWSLYFIVSKRNRKKLNATDYRECKATVADFLNTYKLLPSGISMISCLIWGWSYGIRRII